MATFFQSYVLWLALAAANAMADAAAADKSDPKFSFFPTAHVDITNGFSNDVLHIHCESGDDDLGVQDLNPGQDYRWKFRTNFWATTLFRCSFWWNGGYHENDVYWVDRHMPDGYCIFGKYCKWKAQEDGIYLFEADKGVLVRWYEWQKW